MNSFCYLMNGNQDSSQRPRVDNMQTVKYKFSKDIFYQVLVLKLFKLVYKLLFIGLRENFILKIQIFRIWYMRIGKSEKKALLW